MKIQFTRDSVGYPNGYVKHSYTAGQELEGDAAYLRNFIQEGSAVEIQEFSGQVNQITVEQEPADDSGDGVAASESESETGAERDGDAEAATQAEPSQAVHSGKKHRAAR